MIFINPYPILFHKFVKEFTLFSIVIIHLQKINKKIEIDESNILLVY